jgi:hypothetical protein
MGFSYNPQVTPNQDKYIYAGMDALGQGLGSFLQQQRKHAEEMIALKAQDAKNQVILQHAATTINPATGQPYLSQDDVSKYYQGSLKDKTGIAEGLGANIAFDTAIRNQQIVNQGHQAAAYNQSAEGYRNLVTGTNLAYPKPAGPVVQVPVIDSTTGQPTGRTAVTGGDLPHTQLNDAPFTPSIQAITGPDGKLVNIFHKAPNQFDVYDPQGNRLELTDEEKQAYAATGKIPLRTSAKSFVPESMVGQPTDAVKGFDETIGKRYGLKSADLYKIDFTTPGSIKFFDKSGTQLSTDQAAQAKPDNVDAVIPVAGEMGMVNRTMPLGDWNTIVNAWNQLPRAGQMVQPQAAAQSVAPTNAATSTDPLIQVTSPSGVPGYVPKSKLQDALTAGYKQQ